jgi:DNA-binding transcriptional regulator YiaG
MKEKYQSELLGAIHETASGLHKIGVIDDNEMQEYDEDCLVQKPNPVRKSDNPKKPELVTA